MTNVTKDRSRLYADVAQVACEQNFHSGNPNQNSARWKKCKFDAKLWGSIADALRVILFGIVK